MDDKEQIQILNKIKSTQLIIIILLLVVLFGSVLNSIVIKSNDWSMPIKYKYFWYNYHDSLTTKEIVPLTNVKFSMLADNYLIFGILFSIGDLIMLFTGIGIIFFSIYLIRLLGKLKRSIK